MNYHFQRRLEWEGIASSDANLGVRPRNYVPPHAVCRILDLFSSGPKTSSSTENVAATDEAQAFNISTGKASQVQVLGEGSLSQQAGAQYVSPESVGLSGSSRLQTGGVAGNVGAGAKLGTTEQSFGDVTITSSDAGVLTKALDQVASLSQSFGSSLAQATAAGSAAQQSVLTQALDAFSKKAQGEGEPGLNRNLLYLGGVLLLAIVAAAFFLFRNK